MKSVINLAEWQALANHQKDIADQHMRDWFAKDQHRFDRFSIECGDILLDYSRNRITDHTIHLLCDLANAIQLPQKIQSLFNGHPLNTTENRPALHTALRDKHCGEITVNQEPILPLIAKTKQAMQDIVEQIHSQKWKGVTNKPIKHIVNLGIGGSYLGPMMSTSALKTFAVTDLQFHFISTVDSALIHEVLQQIDPETTLFIISSKSFTTLETLTNAQTISTWMKNKLGHEAIKKHFIAVTADTEKAIAFGIPKAHILSLWDWVGGRYSIWSAIGLPLMLMIGHPSFSDFLEGAYQMDQHVQTAELAKNMPILLALLDIWYINFFGTQAQAIIPYAHQLRYLVPYLQQAQMESNGKSTSLDGHLIPYATSPIIFGEEGCNGQHTYHQLLHQSQTLIPIDFILIGNSTTHTEDIHQATLIASCLSQAQALMQGKTHKEAYQALLAANHTEKRAQELAYHHMTSGNKPSHILFIKQLTPKNLGALIALYEHRIFVQSVIWNINPFDQWGVNIGKTLLPHILKYVQGEPLNAQLDPATTGLIRHLRNMKNPL